jgi:hypothetical protein
MAQKESECTYSATRRQMQNIRFVPHELGSSGGACRRPIDVNHFSADAALPPVTFVPVMPALVSEPANVFNYAQDSSTSNIILVPLVPLHPTIPQDELSCFGTTEAYHPLFFSLSDMSLSDFNLTL